MRRSRTLCTSNIMRGVCCVPTSLARMLACTRQSLPSSLMSTLPLPQRTTTLWTQQRFLVCSATPSLRKPVIPGGGPGKVHTSAFSPVASEVEVKIGAASEVETGRISVGSKEESSETVSTSTGTMVSLTAEEAESVRKATTMEYQPSPSTEGEAAAAAAAAAVKMKETGTSQAAPTTGNASLDASPTTSVKVSLAANIFQGDEAAGEERRDGIFISENPSDIPVQRVLSKVWEHLWPKGQTKIKVLVVGSVACVLTAKVLKIAVPFWFKAIVDALAPATATTAAVTTIGPVGIGVFGCVAAYGICRITTSVVEELKTVLFAPVGGHASTTLAMEMFNKLHCLDLTFHLNRETGVLSKDLDRGSRAFWTLAYSLLFMVGPTAFEMALVCTALQTQAGPQFIVIAVVAVASYVAWTLAVTNWRSKYRARYNNLDSRVGGLIVDSLLNFETVKYFGTEKYESARISTETTKMNNQLVVLDQMMAVLNFGQQFIFAVAGVMSLYFATCGVLSGAMTVGDLVLVDALLMQLYMPLSYLGMIYREVQASTQNMQAMIALLDQNPKVVEREDAKPYVYRNGTIELRNVSFTYKTEVDRPILANLSLTIPGGKTVAFVGPSGSGKSTIFRLLFRFYDPASGEVLFDGQPLQDLQLPSLRECIGVIPQDTVLFNESVKYNILYGRMNATDEEVLEASKKASLHDTVSRMSEGYDTPVGERGLKLSGGEKQRVAIARVLLEDSPILLADEATSALDSTTELNVMRTLKNASQRGTPRTIILIAHRLTTVREADIIFVLDGKGGLAEQGTHYELIARGGLYSEMWFQQLRDRRNAEKTPAESSTKTQRQDAEKKK